MKDPEKNKTGDARDAPWLRDLLLPAYFLALLGVGLWIINPGSRLPDVVLVVYAAILLISIGGLFFRPITYEFDRRNHTDRSRRSPWW
ncbi:MAG TPA: hypothetical protein VMT58_00360 [Candidatus Binataceae bacterium]|nr:hypothetical protein [Candidatus Binataceae bacterium]